MARSFAEVWSVIGKTQAARNASYSASRPGHEVHAAVLAALFPKGAPTGGEAGTRFILLNFIIGKVVRYAMALAEGRGGHQDSIHDVAVYAMILDARHEEGD